MKRYYLDANIILRFVLKDNKVQYPQARDYFARAQKGEITLILIPEAVIEVNYVLRSTYGQLRLEVAKILKSLIHTPYIEVAERILLMEAVDMYAQINADLVDIILFLKAKADSAEVLSFDATDFKKIRKHHEADTG